MGECFISRRGGGGGGSGLNVVTGLSEPSNAKENTIWVKSNAAGKKYVFAETEPESPSEGLIWFTVTSFSGIITKANVYTSGSWVAADTYMYLGGSWVHIASAFSGILFRHGKFDGISGWDGTSVAVGDVIVSTGKARVEKSIGTVDVTNYNTLTITASAQTTSTQSSYIGLSPDGSDALVAKATLNKSANVSQVVIDISSISGQQYIAADINTSSGDVTLRISEMVLS